MRKRICVLLAQLEEQTQNRFMSAFTKEAYAHDYDICIFSMYQKFQETDLRNIGDSNIYSLANFSQFDGLVVLLDTILTPGFEFKLIKTIADKHSELGKLLKNGLIENEVVEGFLNNDLNEMISASVWPEIMKKHNRNRNVSFEELGIESGTILYLAMGEKQNVRKSKLNKDMDMLNDPKGEIIIAFYEAEK